MKNFVWKLRKRMTSRAGESLTETLVALLIAALALTLLAGMITSAVRMVSQSRDRMEAYYTAGNVLESQNEDKGTMTILLAPKDETDTLARHEETVKVYINTTFERTPIISYQRPED